MSEYIKKEDAIRHFQSFEKIMKSMPLVDVKARLKDLHTYSFPDSIKPEEIKIGIVGEGYPSKTKRLVEKYFPDSAENKGDLISRQAVIDELEKWDWQELYLPIHFKQILDDVPSVENKGEDRPKGHWIGHREHCENLGVKPSGLGAYEWCSNCDCGIDVREWHRNDYNYCPNCGADMREPKPKFGNSMLVGKPSLLNQIIPKGEKGTE